MFKSRFSLILLAIVFGLPVLSKSDCKIKCDENVKCAKITGADYREFEWTALLEINTTADDGPYARGTDPNRWRDANAAQICPTVTLPGFVIVWGKGSDCTSNTEYVDFNTAEECFDPGGCGGTGTVICAPVN